MRQRTAYIVGVAESDLGATPQHNPLSLQAQAALRALGEAGLRLSDVDALFTAGDWARHPSASLAEYLGIQPTWTDTTNIGGASFEAHVGHAASGIASGLFDVALITYGSTQRTEGSRKQPRNVEYGTQFDQPAGLPVPVGAYALAATRHMYEFGTTSEQLADVAVSARQWAALNPAAWKRDPITVEDVLASPLVSDPLHVLDCCLVTDGGGAVVVVSEDRLADLETRVPVQVLGHAETSTHYSISSSPDLLNIGAVRSGAQALQRAGISLDDVDVTQIYDSFTITVLLTLEAIGFCKPGEAGEFVADGRTRPGGDFPLNTSGGGLSYCHPGMYGIFLIIEAVRQLRGDCGERQVRDANTALINGTGGNLSSTSTVILGRGA